MSSNLSIGKDINGAVSDILGVSETLYAITLQANVAENLTAPQNIDSVYFSFGSSGDVWVSQSGTATIPGATWVVTHSELNPVGRFVKPGTVLSFICSLDNPVQVAFYNSRAKSN